MKKNMAVSRIPRSKLVLLISTIVVLVLGVVMVTLVAARQTRLGSKASGELTPYCTGGTASSTSQVSGGGTVTVMAKGVNNVRRVYANAYDSRPGTWQSFLKQYEMKKGADNNWQATVNQKDGFKETGAMYVDIFMEGSSTVSCSPQLKMNIVGGSGSGSSVGYCRSSGNSNPICNGQKIGSIQGDVCKCTASESSNDCSCVQLGGSIIRPTATPTPIRNRQRTITPTPTSAPKNRSK